MSTPTSRITSLSKQTAPFAFLLGAVFLIGSWIALYQAEALFTESHLAGYYCCVSEQDLPAHRTLARTLSDFFGTSPGKHLPSLIFVTVNFGLFVAKARRVRGNSALPLVFVILNLLYLVAAFLLVSATWSISTWLIGSITSAYKGYDHTWYGIASHFILWGIFFLALSKVSGSTPAKTQLDEQTYR